MRDAQPPGSPRRTAGDNGARPFPRFLSPSPPPELPDPSRLLSPSPSRTALTPTDGPGATIRVWVAHNFSLPASRRHREPSRAVLAAPPPPARPDGVGAGGPDPAPRTCGVLLSPGPGFLSALLLRLPRAPQGPRSPTRPGRSHPARPEAEGTCPALPGGR